jgi:hypothetical protein
MPRRTVMGTRDTLPPGPDHPRSDHVMGRSDWETDSVSESDSGVGSGRAEEVQAAD